MNVGPDEAKASLERGAVALDVRERWEWKRGHLDAALHIPLGQLGRRLEELPRDTQIVVVCRSGNRSGSVVPPLRERGYDAVNLEGGLQAWRRAGLPLVRGGAASG